jgi:hypothetical protein
VSRKEMAKFAKSDLYDHFATIPRTRERLGDFFADCNISLQLFFAKEGTTLSSDLPLSIHTEGKPTFEQTFMLLTS